METRTLKNIGPPAWIGSLVRALIPPELRDSVEGDWAEDYNSLSKYLYKVGRSLPVIVAGLVRRTANKDFAAGSACILGIAFAGEPIPMLILVAVVLGVLMVREVYVKEENRGYMDAVGYAITGCVSALFVETMMFFGSLHQTSGELMSRGAGVSLMLLSAWRFAFYFKQPRPHSSVADAYSVTLRVNILWMIASLGVIASNLAAVPSPSGPRDAFLTFGSIMAFGLSYYLKVDVLGRIEAQERPTTIFGNMASNDLIIKRGNLLAPPKRPAAGAPRRLSWPTLLEILFFVLIAMPLLSAFTRWFTNDPSVELVKWPMVWTNLGSLIPLVASWLCVKHLNEEVAEELQKEIDALRVKR